MNERKPKPREVGGTKDWLQVYAGTISLTQGVVEK